jgi:tetratricopeptide (TPR) repeat protein
MKKGLLLLLAPLLLGMGDAHYFAVKEGNRHYREGDYGKAAEEYLRALKAKNSGVAKYNLGNVLYKNGEYEKAANLYSQVIGSKEEGVAWKALENFAHSSYWDGSGKMDGGDLEGAGKSLGNAEAAYKKMLLDNPSHSTAKEYLEHTLAKLKKLENMKKNQENEDKQDEKDQNKDKDKDKKSSSDGKKDSKEKDEKQKAEEEEKQATKKREEKKEPGKLSPEEVEGILKALQENEKKVQKEVRRMNVKEKALEKDW